MEKNIKILGIAFAMVIGLAACEKTYMEPQKPVATEDMKIKEGVASKGAFDEETKELTEGVWHITSFQWHLRKESNDHFDGYEFVFLKEGIVIAKSDAGEQQGKWSRQNYFRLAFAPQPLNELNNEHWYFRKESKNRFILKGISPYDDSSEFVVFERK
jgi:hypothetical protein